MTPEEQPFITAICDTPFDDLPRLVYADWLEERGEVSRAEFIRVQCELAKCRPDCGVGKICRFVNGQTCAKLRMRERELWDKHKYDWYGELWDILDLKRRREDVEPRQGYTRAFVYRGLVNRIECTLAEFMGGTCTHCNGSGRDNVPYGERCDHCRGTGRTPGLVGSLFRVQPVTEVVLRNREPGQFEPNIPHHNEDYFWLRGPAMLGLADETQDLHYHIWDELRLYDTSESPRVFSRRYPTREAAMLALSLACVALGRKLAGLKPIVWGGQ